LGIAADRARRDRAGDLHDGLGQKGRVAARLHQENPEGTVEQSGDGETAREKPRLRNVRELFAEWEKEPDFRKACENLPLAFDVMIEISSARARSGLTQTEIAKRMGTTQSAVARLESERLPSLRTLKRYAEAVGAKLVVKLEAIG
jgi:ribosome-binding protein aMBF1 (putative translation factor)